MNPIEKKIRTLKMSASAAFALSGFSLLCAYNQSFGLPSLFWLPIAVASFGIVGSNIIYLRRLNGGTR